MNVHDCESDAGCITCGDVGVPMRVIEVGAAAAVCMDEGGMRHEVAIDLIDSATTGAWLLVHAGVAIAAVEAPAIADDGGPR